MNSYSKQDLRLDVSRDGSQTLYSEKYGQHYHSMHGALSESLHVFIKHGLDRIDKDEVKVLELGFGTGLNALLTLKEAIRRDISIDYTGLELHPVTTDIWSLLNYSSSAGQDLSAQFKLMHSSPWNQQVHIHPNFNLCKREVDMLTADLGTGYDLVYFDAFGPETQPELWSQDLFQRIYDAMAPAGVISTYSCKGDVRRGWMDLGMKVEKPIGPPGKRSMLVGIKD